MGMDSRKTRMALDSLQDKLVLITGAGAGIGRAAALAFARRGAHIIAADLHLAPLDTLREELEALGSRCWVHAVDVADEAAMRAFAQLVAAESGAPHVLINNAGIGYLGRFLDSDLAHWRRVMDINLMGVVHGCHHFLPLMQAAGGPRQVLNVASTAGIYPAPTMAAYAASKAAVFGFSEVLKMELQGSGIGVTTVCPGIIRTDIVKSRGNVAPTVTEAQLQRLQAYYDAKGCSPDVVGEGMVAAVLGGSNLLLVGPYARLIHQLRRISLGLTRRIMLSDARRIGFL